MNKLNINFIVVITLVLFVLLVPAIVPKASAIIVTNDAAVTSDGCVRFNGTNTEAAKEVWFEYSIVTTNGFSLATENQTATGNFYYSQCGVPFLSGYMYKVRATDGNSIGQNTTFVLPVATAIPTLTYSTYVDTFLESYDEPKVMIRIMWTPYTAVMGGMFFGVIVGVIFWNMAVKQRTVALSVLLMMIIGTSIWRIFPDYPEFVWLAQTLFIAGMVGMIYWMFAKRRK
jgi:hypothetical protein